MKKVLFMPVGFFEYDKVIEEEMRNMGYEVTVFSPMASYGKLYQKVCNTITRGNYIKNRAYKLQQIFFTECETQFDYVFAIVGRDIDAGLFADFKKKQKRAKFILYLWDDIARINNFNNICALFDKIITFDSEDSQKYKYEFLPLFYTKNHLYQNQEKKYKLAMVASLHSERIDIYRTIYQKMKLGNDDSYLYVLAGSIQGYLKGKKQLKEVGIDAGNIHIYGLSMKESIEKICEAKIAVDVQFGSQAGLTIRTIESLATKTKLITTNEHVKEYDFYNPANICVINKNNVEVPKEFFETPYQEIDTEILEKYSLKNWLKEILSSESKE